MYLSILFLVLLHTGAVAQNEHELLSKVNKTYLEAKAFSMTANVEVYERRGDQKPLSSYSGSMQKSGSMYYSEMMGKITLLNSGCALVVDTEHQLIVYGKAWKGASATNGNIAVVLDTALLKAAKIKLKSQEGKRKIIEIVPGNKMYDKIEVVINSDNNTLEAITYYYAASELTPYQKLKISYGSIRINPKIPSSVFSEAKFVTKKGGKIVPVGQWSQYRLVDQTDFKYPKYE